MLGPLVGEMHKLIYPSQVWYSITSVVVDITLIRAKRGSVGRHREKMPLFYSNHGIMYGTT